MRPFAVNRSKNISHEKTPVRPTAPFVSWVRCMALTAIGAERDTSSEVTIVVVGERVKSPTDHKPDQNPHWVWKQKACVSRESSSAGPS